MSCNKRYEIKNKHWYGFRAPSEAKTAITTMKAEGGGGKISLKGIINRVAKALRDLNPFEKTSNTNVKTGLVLAKRYVREAGGKHKLRGGIPRVLAIPKTGGFIFTIPAIFGALSAIGALSGGAAGIAKAVNDSRLPQRH